MELVLHFLACWRLCQLAIRDRITLPIRGRLIRWAYQRADGPDQATDAEPATLGEWDDLAQADADAPPLAILVTCWWCAGLWIAAGWTGFAAVWPAGWWWSSVALGASVVLVVGSDVLAVLGKASE